jgi:hypothetical protein
MAKRIIRLTEADIENIVRRVLQEQPGSDFGSGTKKVQTGTTTELQDINVELSNQVFPAGKYKIASLGADGEKVLGETLFKIVTFLKEHPNSPLNIEIEVGESVVPNYDREKCQTGDYSEGCKLESGALGKLRGEELINYLNTEFKRYETDGVITVAPTVTATPTVTIGRKHKTYAGDANNKKYLEDQYIGFKATMTQEVEEPTFTDECLVDMKVTLQYINERGNKKFPCRGIHQCDEARYKVYMNTTLLGVADLNNAKDAGKGVELNRKAEFTIDSDKVLEIVGSESYKKYEQLILWISCDLPKCHNSAIEVKIENKQGEVKNHSCLKPLNVDLGSAAKAPLKEGHLLYMDKCGNVEERNVASEDDAISMSDYMDAQSKQAHQAEVDKVINYYSENIVNPSGNIMSFVMRKDSKTKEFIPGVSIVSVDGDITVKSRGKDKPGLQLTVNVTKPFNVPVAQFPNGDTKKYFTDKGQEYVTIPSGTDVKIGVPLNQVNVPVKSKKKFEKSLAEKLNSGTSNRFYKIDIGGQPYIMNTAGRQIAYIKRLIGDDTPIIFERGLSKINYV